MVVILSLYNLETLFEPKNPFLSLQKALTCIMCLLKTLSNQACKQLRPIKVLKMQKTFFTRIMTLQTKLLVIIYAYKISEKKCIFFFKQNLKILLESLALKPKKIEGHLIMYLHQFQSYLNKGSNSFFFLKD